MKDKFAQKTLAAIISLINEGYPAPDRPSVAKFKAIKSTTIDEACDYFHAPFVDYENAQHHLDSVKVRARELYKELAPLELSDVRDKYALAFNSYADIPADAKFTGDIKSPRAPSEVPQLLAQVNAVRCNNGLAPLKSWSASTDALRHALRTQQQTRFDKLKAILEGNVVYPGETKKQRTTRIASHMHEAEALRTALGIKDVIATNVTKLPPAVAEGAYVSKEEQVAKTAHTTNGKSKSQVKYEAKKDRMVERALKDGHKTKQPSKAAIKAVVDAASNTQQRKRDVADGEVSLAQIASKMKVTPKQARALARKHKAKLGKLEVRKYIYKSADQEKILAILRG